jgi:hypothetical protein
MSYSFEVYKTCCEQYLFNFLQKKQYLFNEMQCLELKSLNLIFVSLLE